MGWSVSLIDKGEVKGVESRPTSVSEPPFYIISPAPQMVVIRGCTAMASLLLARGTFDGGVAAMMFVSGLRMSELPCDLRSHARVASGARCGRRGDHDKGAAGGGGVDGAHERDG